MALKLVSSDRAVEELNFLELFSIESSANVSLDINPVEDNSEKSGFMLVFNRNSGGEEESDVFGNGVWEVGFWN